MDNVTSFFGLLGLFMFIFAVLGMNIFGCKFCQLVNVEDEEAVAAAEVNVVAMGAPDSPTQVFTIMK